MDKEILYRKAIKKWGINSQIEMMIEEMAELTVELCHVIRGRGCVGAVEEELADVEIMLEQMKILASSIEKIKEEKLKRLAILLENDETKKEIKMDKFKKYTRKGFSEMRPYISGEDMDNVSVADVDTPEVGGMIARNPKNHEDQWYVAKQYFEDNLELAE